MSGKGKLSIAAKARIEAKRSTTFLNTVNRSKSVKFFNKNIVGEHVAKRKKNLPYCAYQ